MFHFNSKDLGFLEKKNIGSTNERSVQASQLISDVFNRSWCSPPKTRGEWSVLFTLQTDVFQGLPGLTPTESLKPADRTAHSRFVEFSDGARIILSKPCRTSPYRTGPPVGRPPSPYLPVSPRPRHYKFEIASRFPLP
jgi:hypothetical protein